MFQRRVRDEAAMKWFTRIGDYNPEQLRPIKIHLRSEDDKKKIMSNLVKLKGVSVFNGLIAEPDYTLTSGNEFEIMMQMQKI